MKWILIVWLVGQGNPTPISEHWSLTDCKEALMVFQASVRPPERDGVCVPDRN